MPRTLRPNRIVTAIALPYAVVALGVPLVSGDPVLAPAWLHVPTHSWFVWSETVGRVAALHASGRDVLGGAYVGVVMLSYALLIVAGLVGMMSGLAGHAPVLSRRGRIGALGLGLAVLLANTLGATLLERIAALGIRSPISSSPAFWLMITALSAVVAARVLADVAHDLAQAARDAWLDRAFRAAHRPKGGAPRR